MEFFLEKNHYINPMKTWERRILGATLLLIGSLSAAPIGPEKVAMPTLATWGALSLLGGTSFAIWQTNETLKSFGIMTAGWGAVNLAIAGFALFGPASTSSESSQSTVYLINAALDVLYMGAGAWMWVGGKNSADRQALWQGFGIALVSQGAFLLIFDAVLAGLHAEAARPGANFSATPLGPALQVHWRF